MKRFAAFDHDGLQLTEIVDDTKKRLSSATIRELILGLAEKGRVPFSMTWHGLTLDTTEGFYDSFTRAMNAFHVAEGDQFDVLVSYGEIIPNYIKYSPGPVIASVEFIGTKQLTIVGQIHVPGHSWDPVEKIPEVYLNPDPIKNPVQLFETHGRGILLSAETSRFLGFSPSGDTAYSIHTPKTTMSLAKIGVLLKQVS